jgi:hypothetical protein
VVGAGDNGSFGLAEYVDGVIDDVRIYDRALSAAEVQSLVQAGGGAGEKSAAMSRAPQGEGSCGLTGLEAIALLVWLRRRRRS